MKFVLAERVMYSTVTFDAWADFGGEFGENSETVMPLRIEFAIDGAFAEMELELVRQAEILFGEAMPHRIQDRNTPRAARENDDARHRTTAARAVAPCRIHREFLGVAGRNRAGRCGTPGKRRHQNAIGSDLRHHTDRHRCAPRLGIENQ